MDSKFLKLQLIGIAIIILIILIPIFNSDSTSIKNGNSTSNAKPESVVNSNPPVNSNIQITYDALAGYDPQTSVQIKNECLFENLPNSYNVYVVSSYAGFNQIDVAIDKNENENSLNDVIVNIKDNPIILVFTAYKPVVWRIQSTAGTKIAGIVLSGYYNQAVLGVSKNIPIVNWTHSQNTCGYFYLNNATDANQAAIIGQIKEIAGKEPINILYQSAADHIFYVGQPLSNTDRLLYSNDYQLSDYKVNSDTAPKNLN